MDKKIIGQSGEDLAENFLKNLGYQILAKNYRTQLGEIDIIAQEKNELVIVEVKTRKTSDFGYPEEFVTKSKIQKIKKATLDFLGKNPHKFWRIDIISITYQPKIKIEHFKNITG